MLLQALGFGGVKFGWFSQYTQSLSRYTGAPTQFTDKGLDVRLGLLRIAQPSVPTSMRHRMAR